jgi:hypothetical protein
VWLAAGVFSSDAQEALRASLASADAAAARRQAITRVEYYNVKLGDMTWRFTGGFGVEFTDNANLSDSDPESDVILSPTLGANMRWPITDKNALNLNLGVGYSYYQKDDTKNRWFLNPGTELSFDLYVGDFVFNLHDRPSLNQYAYQNASVSGTGDYSEFQNTVGIAGRWDLNKAEANFGYDHNNYMSMNSTTQSRDGSSDVVYISAGAEVRPEIQVGVDSGAGLIQYRDTVSPDAIQWNAGLYTRFLASQYLNFKINVGYTAYDPDDVGLFALLPTSTAIYLNLEVRHRLNQYVDYSLTGGRGVNVSFNGRAYENYYADLNVTWHVLHKITVGTPFRWEQGTDVYGPGNPFSQYQTGILFGRNLTEKLSGSVGYRLVVRDGETRSGDYVVRSMSLNLNYRF